MVQRYKITLTNKIFILLSKNSITEEIRIENLIKGWLPCDNIFMV